MKRGDILTTVQLMEEFDKTINAISDIRREQAAAGITFAHMDIHKQTQNLHLIWKAMMDLTIDAYPPGDLVEIR